MKIWHLFSLLLTSFVFTSCAVFTATYDLSLSEVERPSQKDDSYGEKKISKESEAGVSKYVFEDDVLKVIWIPTRTSFDFTMLNKSNNSIKIIWDEAVYVDASGSSKMVFHTGVKYIDRNNPQPPTIVVKGASITDLLTPTDNVYFVSGQYGGWKTKDLFPRYANKDEIDGIKKAYSGKVVKISLPIQIEGVTNEYIYSFKINDLVIK
jgi:hypothetical protein